MRASIAAGCLAFLLASGGAHAAPVTVAAGEHPGFTRLVLEFGVLPDWSLGTTSRGYALDFVSDIPPAFDLSRVFRLIDRGRVSDIRSTATGLEIDIACDCRLFVSTSVPESLVVDVKPRRMPPDPAVSAPQVPPVEPVPLRDPFTFPGSDGNAETAGGPPVGAFPVTPLPWALDEMAGWPDSTRDALLATVGREFSRAAAQGLIEADPETGRPPSAVPPVPIPGAEGHANISVVTSLDRVITSDRPDLPPTDSGLTCLPDDSIDVAAWWGEVAALGRTRQAAVGEDGSVTEDGARKLARLYLAQGFGAEAIVVARLLPDHSEQMLLIALADIMDFGKTASAVLNGQIFCEGHVALWAVLAQPLGKSDAPLSTDHILSAFSELPAHLRAHLGPTLAERLRGAGLDEAARAAVNAVTRGGSRTDESELATARLDLSGTHATDARHRLEGLSDGTDVTAAAALLELLLDAEARDMPPNPAWVEDAPTLVRAVEGTEVSERLNLAGLRGLIALDRYEAFRSAIIESTPGLTDETRRDLSIRAFGAVAKRGDDRQFLESVIALEGFAKPGDLPRETRFAISARYAALGLGRNAEAYLPDDPASAEELKVAADVLTTTGRMAEAALLLAASDDPAAPGLLGKVLVASKRDRDAVPVLASAGRSDAAARAAIRAADWTWLADSETGALADAARDLTLADQVSGVSETAPNGSLIERSRTLRDRAGTLLDATDMKAAFTN